MPNTLHTLQEAALWPTDFRRLPYSLERLPYGPGTSGRPPYSQETAPTVPPAHPSFKNRHTHSTQHTQPSRRPQGPYRLQDYKTAQPANREHNKMPRRRQIQRKAQQRQYREKPDKEAKYRHLICSGITSGAG